MVSSYRLVPTLDMQTTLAADYARISAMIFGKPPSFDDVMSNIEALEKHLDATPAPAHPASADAR